MRTYTAKECSCWQDYPNDCYKKKDQWKCVDCYELVSEREGHHKKTHCRLKENLMKLELVVPDPKGNMAYPTVVPYLDGKRLEGIKAIDKSVLSKGKMAKIIIHGNFTVEDGVLKEIENESKDKNQRQLF